MRNELSSYTSSFHQMLYSVKKVSTPYSPRNMPHFHSLVVYSWLPYEGNQCSLVSDLHSTRRRSGKIHSSYCILTRKFLVKFQSTSRLQDVMRHEEFSKQITLSSFRLLRQISTVKCRSVSTSKCFDKQIWTPCSWWLSNSSIASCWYSKQLRSK